MIIMKTTYPVKHSMLSDALGVGQNEPRGQSVAALAPVPQINPTGHGSEATLPEGQYVPFMHKRHVR
jgi:hypothetical protein